MLIDNSSKIYNGTNEIVKVYAGSDVVYEKTPYTPYTELNYIQSRNKSQYIDTGITANSNITVDVDFSINETLSGWHALIGGGDGPYGSNIFCNGVTNNGSITGGWMTRGPSTNGYNFSGNNIMQYNLRTNIKCLKTSCIYTNTNGTTTFSVPNEYNFASSYTLYLFAQNKSNSIDDKANLRIYYCKIYDNGTLVRDFIPVLDENDVPCLYDKVSKAYFYNQGSGTFLYG